MFIKAFTFLFLCRREGQDGKRPDRPAASFSFLFFYLVLLIFCAMRNNWLKILCAGNPFIRKIWLKTQSKELYLPQKLAEKFGDLQYN